MSKYNPVEDPGLYYSVADRLKKKRKGKDVQTELVRPATSSASSSTGFNISILPFRIGLDRMGVKFEDNTVMFSPPLYGPPRADFWNDPADLHCDITDTFCVVRVNSPNEFWVQNVKARVELLALEHVMTKFYNKNWEEGKTLSENAIFEGGFYAGYLTDYDSWVRVRITEPVYSTGPKEWIVHVLDYGTERLMQTEDLYYLKPAFNELPMQSAKMELYYEDVRHAFSAEERVQFDKDVGGQEINVIVLHARQEPDHVFTILRGVMLKRCVSTHKEPLRPEDFYSVNGRLDVSLMCLDINRFQATI